MFSLSNNCQFRRHVNKGHLVNFSIYINACSSYTVLCIIIYELSSFHIRVQCTELYKVLYTFIKTCVLLFSKQHCVKYQLCIRRHYICYCCTQQYCNHYEYCTILLYAAVPYIVLLYAVPYTAPVLSTVLVLLYSTGTFIQHWCCIQYYCTLLSKKHTNFDVFIQFSKRILPFVLLQFVMQKSTLSFRYIRNLQDQLLQEGTKVQTTVCARNSVYK